MGNFLSLSLGVGKSMLFLKQLVFSILIFLFPHKKEAFKRRLNILKMRRHLSYFGWGPRWLQKLFYPKNISLLKESSRKILITFICLLSILGYTFVSRFILPVFDRITLNNPYPQKNLSGSFQSAFPYAPSFLPEEITSDRWNERRESLIAYKISPRKELTLKLKNSHLFSFIKKKIHFSYQLLENSNQSCELKIRDNEDNLVFRSVEDYDSFSFPRFLKRMLKIGFLPTPPSPWIHQWIFIRPWPQKLTISSNCIYGIGEWKVEEETPAPPSYIKVTYDKFDETLEHSILDPQNLSSFKLPSSEQSFLKDLENKNYSFVSLGLNQFSHSIVFDSFGYHIRYLTDSAIDWMKEYHYQPFFMHIHYQLVKRGLSKPPLSFIRMRYLLSTPWDLQKELYPAALKALKKEVSYLKTKLSQDIFLSISPLP